MRKKKASGEGIKLVGQKNYYHRNSTKASSIYNSMNQRNKVSSLRPQLPISGHFQFPNLARSSMEELNPRSTWTAAGSYLPAVPEFKWFDNFASNNSILKPCDQYLGFGPNNTNSYNPEYALESKCSNSASQTFGNCPIDNVGTIPDQAAALAWSFPNNATAGMWQYNHYIKSNQLLIVQLSSML